MVKYVYPVVFNLFISVLLMITQCTPEHNDMAQIPANPIKRLIRNINPKTPVDLNVRNLIQKASLVQQQSLSYPCNCSLTPSNPFCLVGLKNLVNNERCGADISDKKLGNINELRSVKEKRHIHREGPLLKLNTTIGTIRKYRRPILPGSNLTVKYKECGFIFCYAQDFYLNHSVQRWDYHVEWTIPNQVAKAVPQNRVFVLGNNFQLAHAYLVFRRFDRTYEGIYSCRLSFFGTVVLSADVALVFSEAESEKQCVMDEV